MKRREFVVGVVGGAAGTLAWERLGPRRRETVPDGGRLSFSEQGEDIVVYHALRDLLKIERPTYMDVGAAHPVRSNNTYMLYYSGSRGLLVEPNPMYVEMLRRQRPGDAVLAAGIGVTDEAEADYYEIKDRPLLNTFSPETVAALQQGKTESVVARKSKMPLVNINRAITEHLGGRAPDFLSTDIEGLDTAIIKSLDLTRFRPGVICCEGVSIYKAGNTSYIAQHLVPQGYILRGGSMVNSIFVDAKRIEA